MYEGKKKDLEMNNIDQVRMTSESSFVYKVENNQVSLTKDNN